MMTSQDQSEGTGMHFLGRETEIAKIKKALSHGRNVVVTGKYGIGRTSLIRRFSLLNQETWRFLFADFSAPPSKVCHRLLADLQPDKPAERRGKEPGYRQSRILVVDLATGQERRCVLVLDNIGKLTPQKMEFIRPLGSDHGVLFIAIAERFLPEDDLFRLRISLYPSELIRLGQLSANQTAKFSGMRQAGTTSRERKAIFTH